MQIIYSNFIEDIIKNENLIDIGRLGKASQSSLSKWSKENDAQRAVSGKDFKDYAFHTEKEVNPWWQIDFSRPFNIQHIVINNRKAEPYNQIASKIEVYGLSEDGLEVLIHKGQVVFGSLPNSLPLILSLYGKNRFKAITIKLKDTNYLHLCCISVLAKVNILDSLNESHVFVGNRTDGLGERLKSILNVILLSKITGGDFRFSWKSVLDHHKKFHATSTKEEIFNKEFINKRIIDNTFINSMKLIPLSELNTKNIDSYDGILVNQSPLYVQTSEMSLRSGLDYKWAYESIGFSDNIVLAQQSANGVTQKNKTVSIHLRAGDIVYAQHRITNSCVPKVIPAYIASLLIDYFKELGYQVIIFGQDEIFCEGICKDKDVLYSQHLCNPKFSEAQKAIFDITLMSESEIIVGGQSGFSTFAGLVGGVPVKYFDKFFSYTEIIKAFYDAMDECGTLNRDFTSPLMKSYSIMHFLIMYGDHLGVDHKLKLINFCKELDEKNTFFQIMKSVYLFENGDYSESEVSLLELFRPNLDYDIYWLVRDNKLNYFLKPIRFCAENGSAVFAAILLMCNIHNSTDIDIKLYEDILLNTHNQELGWKILNSELEKFKGL